MTAAPRNHANPGTAPKEDVTRKFPGNSGEFRPSSGAMYSAYLFAIAVQFLYGELELEEAIAAIEAWPGPTRPEV